MSDADKRFQLYTDLVLKKKIGDSDFQRQRFASAIAAFLMLRDLSAGALNDVPSLLGLGPRVDSRNQTAEETKRLNTIAYKQMYLDAKDAISSMGFAAVIAVFVEGHRMRDVGAKLLRRPIPNGADGHSSVYNAVARAHITASADQLVRHFQRKRR